MSEWHPPYAEMDISVHKHGLLWVARVVNTVDPARGGNSCVVIALTEKNIWAKANKAADRLGSSWNRWVDYTRGF